MHEIGILYQMIDMAEKVAKENHVRKIDAICVEVGELSGVLPVFLDKYWPIAIESHEMLSDSQLIVKTILGEGICNSCKTLYNIARHEGACPKCGSRDKSILSGRDFVVKSVVFHENTEGTPGPVAPCASESV